MLKLALLLIGGMVPTSTPSDLKAPDAPRCDDGSDAYDEEGLPNWSCSRQGCSPEEGLCWDYRLDHCFDENGDETGSCLIDVQECNSRWECFDMWFYCAGEYECIEDGVVGCKRGKCTTDGSASSRGVDEYQP